MNDNYYKHYDKRVSDRYIEKGIVKPQEFEAHLKNLPDDSANAVLVQMDLDEAELTDVSDDESDLANE
jgi:hypothetical protein